MREIENIKNKYSMDYLEALIYYCDIHSLEEDQIAQFVVGPLKERLAKEALSLHLIAKDESLPLPL